MFVYFLFFGVLCVFRIALLLKKWWKWWKCVTVGCETRSPLAVCACVGRWWSSSLEHPLEGDLIWRVRRSLLLQKKKRNPSWAQNLVMCDIHLVYVLWRFLCAQGAVCQWWVSLCLGGLWNRKTEERCVCRSCERWLWQLSRREASEVMPSSGTDYGRCGVCVHSWSGHFTFLGSIWIVIAIIFFTS